jgi:hypothetical protein
VIQENEIVMLILGGGVFIFTLVYQMRIKRIPEWQILVSGFYFLFAGWVLTVIESFFWENPLNYLEHLSYACSSTLMAVWCWRVIFGGKKGTKL